MKRTFRLPEKVKVCFFRCRFFYAVLCSAILFVMMEIANRNSRLFQMDWRISLVNIITYLIVITALWLMTGKWGTGCAVCSFLFTVFGIINLYSLDFRWMPISTRDIHSVKTAWNVLDAYEALERWNAGGEDRPAAY